MRRFLTTIPLVAAVIAAMTLLPAAPAAAGDTGSCAGNLVLTKDLKYNNTKIGELDIYYNSSTGVNCAKMNHGGPTWGVSRDSWVYIAVCQATSPTGNCQLFDNRDASDPGVTAFYAGPVKVTAGAHCVQANGWIFWQGAERKVATAATVLC